jgi:hypothetical protein
MNRMLVVIFNNGSRIDLDDWYSRRHQAAREWIYTADLCDNGPKGVGGFQLG